MSMQLQRMFELMDVWVSSQAAVPARAPLANLDFWALSPRMPIGPPGASGRTILHLHVCGYPKHCQAPGSHWQRSPWGTAWTSQAPAAQ
jgi:hypothetical protein